MKRINKEIQVALVSLMESGNLNGAMHLAQQLDLKAIFQSLRFVEMASPSETLMKMQ